MADAIADRFASDTNDHKLTILHDDGLYRHLRFKRPDSLFYWFDIVTWPGVLAIRGDVDNRMFSRLPDMFEFFRGQRVNPGYWAEKTPDYGKSAKQHSPEVLRAQLESHLADYAETYDDRATEYVTAKAHYDALPQSRRWPRGRTKEPVEPKTVDQVRDIVAEHAADGMLDHPDGSRSLLEEFERLDVVSDVWEWDVTDWTWSYLWVCHAIVWGIAEYDSARAPAAPRNDSGVKPARLAVVDA